MSNESTTTVNAFQSYLDANPNSLILIDFNHDIQFVNHSALYFLVQNSFTKSSLKTIFDFITPHYHTILESSLNDVSAMIINQKEVVVTLNHVSQNDTFIILSIHRYAFQNLSGLQVQVQAYFGV